MDGCSFYWPGISCVAMADGIGKWDLLNNICSLKFYPPYLQNISKIVKNHNLQKSRKILESKASKPIAGHRETITGIVLASSQYHNNFLFTLNKARSPITPAAGANILRTMVNGCLVSRAFPLGTLFNS